MQVRSFWVFFSFEGTGEPFAITLEIYKIFPYSHKDPLVDDDYKNIDLIEEAVTVLQENLVRYFIYTFMPFSCGLISGMSTTLFASSQLDKKDVLSV